MELVVVGPDSTIHDNFMEKDRFPPDCIVQSECMLRHAVSVLGWHVADGNVSLSRAFFVDVVCSSTGTMSEKHLGVNLVCDGLFGGDS